MKRRNKYQIKTAVSCITAASLAFSISLPGPVPAEENAHNSGSEISSDKESITYPFETETDESSESTFSHDEGTTMYPDEKVSSESSESSFSHDSGDSAFSYETETDEAVSEYETETENQRERITISGAEDLEALAQRCRVDSASKNLEVILTEDISLAGRSFTPIPFFSGVFDGQGHTIRGISLRSDGSCLGLFRHVGEGALVRDLNVEGRIDPGGSASSLGGIAGDNAGTILNCSFKGNIRAQEDAGGIAGINEKSGLICSCTFSGKVIAPHRAGGIAGRNDGSIAGCTSEGEVNTEYIETDAQTKSSLAAGLSNLSSFDVSSVSEEDFVDIMDIGGIAGYSEGLISECLSTGTVGYAHTGYNVGGIAGRSCGFTVRCTNEGPVYGRRDVGGILGQVEPESIWEYSRSQLEDLQQQLHQLNALIDALSADVSDSTDAIRDDVHAASSCAEDTIQDLQSLTNEIGFDVEKTSAAISESARLLRSAYDEKNAQALRDALSQLAQLVRATDFFSQPVYVTVTGDTAKNTDVSSQLSSVLDAREAAWWQKLDDYLNSREQNSGQGSWIPVPSGTSDAGNTNTPIPDTVIPDIGNPDPGLIDSGNTGTDIIDPNAPDSELIDSGTSDTGNTDAGANADTSPQEDVPAVISDLSDGSDTIVPDEDLSAGIIGGDGAVPSADSGTPVQAAGSDDVYMAAADSDDAYMASAGSDETSVPVAGNDEAFMAAAGMEDSAAVPDTEYVIPEESVMTGSGNIVMEQTVRTRSEDTTDGDIIVEDTGDDGTTVLDYNSDLDRNVSLGDVVSVDKSRDSDVKVDVNANLPDTDQLRSLLNAVLTDTASLLDPASVENALLVLQQLQITPPDSDSFYQNFEKLAASTVPVADDASLLAGKAESDIDAITSQMDQIVDTFFSLTENISLDDRYEETDISRQDPYQSDSSSVESCRNTGEVNGDTNAGGIVGSIGFENRIDAEGKLDISRYLLNDAKYTIFASVRKCFNSGAVTAKKEAAGGIAGSMEFGIVTDSANTGEVRVQEEDFCGGICGSSQGTITQCVSKCLLSGHANIGGIAGKGGSLSECISYSYIGDGTEFLGAIAGSADGEVNDCLYVDYGIGGIDNVGYEGTAQPLPPEPEQAETKDRSAGESGTGKPDTAESGMADSGTGDSGTGASGMEEFDMGEFGAEGSDAESFSSVNACTVSFVVEGEVWKEVSVPFGGSLETLPHVPNKDDDYWQWDDFDQEHIFSDQTVTGAYYRPTTTLASEGDVPDYLAEGIFYDGQTLTVTDFVPAQSPVSTESIADLIGEKIHETETEQVVGRIRHVRKEIEHVITDKLTGPLLDAKTISVNDYDKDLTVRVKAVSGGRLFTTSQDDTTLTESPYTTDGSYIVFELKNGGSFAYYESLRETIRQNSGMRRRIAIICGVAAAGLLALILLIRRRRKKKKSKKNQKTST